MLNRKCPRADELASMVAAGKSSRKVSNHVAQCATCAQIVANLRRDAKLVEDLQSAVKSPPDDTIREDLLNACRSARRPPSSS